MKSSSDNVLCLQETRIGRNNIRSATRDVESIGRSLFPGELLSGIIRSDGHHTTMHGGTAVIACSELTRPCQPTEDVSGRYSDVFRSKRANACWSQVTPNTKVLIFPSM